MIILSFDVGIVNLAYCIFDSNLCKILHWEVITLENVKDHCRLHVNLIQSLDSRKHLTDHIDTVLIEKQPSFNPKMRIIAGCLQSYFFIRGVIDAEYKIKTIKFFSPKHKLKCHNGPELVVSGSTKYSRTKKMGVIICREKLEEYSETTEIKELFEKSKKKDDLADSYLQAITYNMMFLSPNQINVWSGSDINTERPKQTVINTKALIKKELKLVLESKLKNNKLSILELMEFKNNEEKTSILNLMNNLPEILTISIKNKMKYSFPLDSTKLIELLGSLSLKSYYYKSYFI